MKTIAKEDVKVNDEFRQICLDILVLTDEEDKAERKRLGMKILSELGAYLVSERLEALKVLRPI